MKILINTISAIFIFLLFGCSLHAKHAKSRQHTAMKVHDFHKDESDLIPVIAALHDQMQTWVNTPYQWGGTKLNGVDCSGFIWRTLKDRFNIDMQRVTTRELIQMGRKISSHELSPGDLVFFKIHRQLHVGFYDTDGYFLHASVSKGVTRSSLKNPYWKSVFLEARRMKIEYGARISFNYPKVSHD